MAFKEGEVLGTVSINATGTKTTAIGATSNSGTINIGNTSSGAINIDCGVAGLTLGTTANAHTTVLGSIDTTAATTVQGGSGALNITGTNAALTINSGTGTLAIANDATGQTVNISTGGAAKVATLGNTTGASSLALQTGTADFALTSATGTIISALDTGQITYPLQPKFFARLNANKLSVTGNGTIYTIINGTIIFNIGSNYSSVTGKFTAPTTGYYRFIGEIFINALLVTHTQMVGDFYINAVQWPIVNLNPYPINVAAGTNSVTINGSVIAAMTAGQTAELRVTVSGGTKVVNVVSGLQTFFAGYLIG